MTSVETVSALLDWANKNITNNLDFLPDDKLTWKPQPTSKSPLEIVNHMAGTLAMMTAGVTGEPKQDLPEATTRDEAKSLVSQVINTHVAAIKKLSDEQMKETAHLEIGDFPMGMAIAMPVIETVNHHGQLTYIETLLGDDESHLLLK